MLYLEIGLERIEFMSTGPLALLSSCSSRRHLLLAGHSALVSLR